MSGRGKGSAAIAALMEDIPKGGTRTQKAIAGEHRVGMLQIYKQMKAQEDALEAARAEQVRVAAEQARIAAEQATIQQQQIAAEQVRVAAEQVAMQERRLAELQKLQRELFSSLDNDMPQRSGIIYGGGGDDGSGGGGGGGGGGLLSRQGPFGLEYDKHGNPIFPDGAGSLYLGQTMRLRKQRNRKTRQNRKRNRKTQKSLLKRK